MELRDYTDADAWFTERLEDQTGRSWQSSAGSLHRRSCKRLMHGAEKTVEGGDWWFVIEDAGEARWRDRDLAA